MRTYVDGGTAFLGKARRRLHVFRGRSSKNLRYHGDGNFFASNNFFLPHSSPATPLALMSQYLSVPRTVRFAAPKFRYISAPRAAEPLENRRRAPRNAWKAKIRRSGASAVCRVFCAPSWGKTEGRPVYLAKRSVVVVLLVVDRVGRMRISLFAR